MTFSISASPAMSTLRDALSLTSLAAVSLNSQRVRRILSATATAAASATINLSSFRGKNFGAMSIGTRDVGTLRGFGFNRVPDGTNTPFIGAATFGSISNTTLFGFPVAMVTHITNLDFAQETIHLTISGSATVGTLTNLRIFKAADNAYTAMAIGGITANHIISNGYTRWSLLVSNRLLSAGVGMDIYFD